MKIALVQNAPQLGQTGSNLERLDSLIGAGCGADIYVLPEMFATGQSNDPRIIAQDMDGSILNWLRNKASELNAAIVGSVPIQENGLYYNRQCFAEPDGNVTVYNKRHLFTYSGEGEFYTPGSERVVVTFRGLRILLQICYDLRFPVFSRSRDDYDAIIYTANWPDKRISAWDILVRARAIENQCYVFAVNKCGTDAFGNYPGHSVIIGPYGDTMLQTNGDEQITAQVLDLDRLYHFREKFPVLQDAD